jgi:type IV pilus assembly protein PilX
MTRTALSREPMTARSKQAGATLIVGLVLLLVLTVVGVSGMNSATMEIAMAGNTQFQQDAFQLAEAGIDTSIAQELYSFDGATRTLSLLGTPGNDRSATITYMAPYTEIPDEANSAGIPGATKAFHYQILSVSQGPRGGTSTHTQSFYIRGKTN